MVRLAATSRSGVARHLVALALFVIFGAVGLVGLPACGQPHEPEDRVSARIDGTPVYDSEVKASIAAAALAGRELGYRRALDQLIDDVLVATEAGRLGIVIDAAEIESQITAAADSFGGRRSLKRVLQKSGLTLDSYGDRLAAALLAERLAAAKFPRTRATSVEAREYVVEHPDEFTRPAEFDLSDIVVKKREHADAVGRWLGDGGSFAEAARRFSVDPGGRAKSGRMGWVSAASVPAEIRRELTALRAGEVTPPVEALGAWHVVKLHGRRAAHSLTFAEVGDKVVAELTRRRRVAELRSWLERARRRADIEIVD